MSYDPVGGILDGSVRLDVTYDSIAGILHCSVVFDMADNSVRLVLDSPSFEVTDDSIRRILDGPITFEMPGYLVRRVLDGSVRLDITNCPITRIADTLSVCSAAEKQQAERKQDCINSLHHICKNNEMVDIAQTFLYARSIHRSIYLLGYECKIK